MSRGEASLALQGRGTRRAFLLSGELRHYQRDLRRRHPLLWRPHRRLDVFRGRRLCPCDRRDRRLSYSDAVHPAVIAQGLGEFLYKGSIPKEQITVVSGGYGIARYTRRWLRAYRPGQICNGSYQYGAIGPDCGYAFGAAAAVQQGVGPQAPYQGTPVIAITGDAGFAYSGMEVETLSKYKFPAIIIVYNNNAWGVWGQGPGKPLHMYLFQENIRYDKVGEALGARGEYVTRPEDFLPALKRSYKLAADEKVSTVINCQAKKEFWRRTEYPPGFLGKVEPGCMAYNH